MTRIGFKITLKSATLLASGPATGNLSETLNFIPGNSLRGILARHYLELHGGKTDPQFKKLFLSNKVRYGFGYLEGAQPIPLSARSCKYHGGFCRDGSHGVLDLLLLKNDDSIACPHCPSPVDYFRGYGDTDEYRQHIPLTRLIVRTAIDAKRGTAKTGYLYTQKVLEEGQVFSGGIETDDQDLAAKLKKLLATPFSARIGTGSSRGQGWILVESHSNPSINWPNAARRFQRFQEKTGVAMLAITLLSDALFSDDYLRDTTRLPLELLQRHEHGIDPDQWQAEPEQAYLETRWVHGFDGEPIHLPRTPRLAVAAGSVYLFRAKAIATDSLTIPDGNGLIWIGERNDEGYGLAALWHPFHDRPDDAGTDVAATMSDSRPSAHWLKNAQAVFQQGEYQRISPAQMAAVNQRIVQALTWQAAKDNVADFLGHQLSKLEKKQERGHPPSAWALHVSNENLGKRLLRWIEKEEYRSTADANQDQLILLQRAWGAFYGLYRYYQERGEFMALDEAAGNTGVPSARAEQ